MMLEQALQASGVSDPSEVSDIASEFSTFSLLRAGSTKINCGLMKEGVCHATGSKIESGSARSHISELFRYQTWGKRPPRVNESKFISKYGSNSVNIIVKVSRVIITQL